jgi:hypothetical protein
MSDDPHDPASSLKWMDPRFITLDRTKYMEVYEILRRAKGPALRVRATELAAVVRGARDEALPQWARDIQCLAELTQLITANRSVWVCPKCDTIVSFYDAPDEDFVMAACKVYSDHPIPCAYCGCCQIVIWDSKALLKGTPLEHPDVPSNLSVDDVNSREEPAENTFHPPSKMNTLFLRRVLSDMRHHNLENDDTLLNFVGKKIRLQPQFDNGHWNDLGLVWDGVQRSIAASFPSLLDVALGVSKTAGLSASCHKGPNGEMAITVELGLLWGTLGLNRLVNYLHGKGHPVLHWKDILENLVGAVSQTAGVSEHRLTPRHYVRPADYDRYDGTVDNAQQEQLKSRIKTWKQLRFVLLHELGHLALGIPRDVLTFDNERRADEWALGIIVGGGDEDDEPWNDKTWVQWNATFWLFEFWHIAEIAQEANPSLRSVARMRWDALATRLHQNGLPLSEKEGSRRIVDETLKEMLAR